jgi:hypothetical protein
MPERRSAPPLSFNEQIIDEFLANGGAVGGTSKAAAIPWHSRRLHSGVER